MIEKPRIHEDEDGNLHVIIPIRFKRKSGRRYMMIVNGDAITPAITPTVKNNLVKAIATAFRWQGMLDSGEVATMKDIAAKEKVVRNYVARLIKLTLLAPDIIEAILDGKQPSTLTLIDIIHALPNGWSDQRKRFGFPEVSTAAKR